MTPGLGSSSGEGNGNPLQYSCLENAMDREVWLQSMGSQRVGHNLDAEQQQSTYQLTVDLIYSWESELSWSSNGKEPACNAGDQHLIPGLGSSSGEGNGNPLQYSCMENPIDRESHRQFVGSQRVEHG